MRKRFTAGCCLPVLAAVLVAALGAGSEASRADTAAPVEQPAAKPEPAPPANAQAKPAPTEPAPSGTPAIVVDDSAVSSLLGKDVKSATGEKLGQITDILVGHSGDVRAAVIDFGGFLGVGSRKIAVDWRMLHFPKTDGMDKLVSDLPFDHLRDAPVYKPGEPIVIMGAPAQPAPPAPKPTPSPAKPSPTPVKP